MPDFVRELVENEDRAIVRGLGSLAFVRAQGRTLEERSQEKILDLLWDVRAALDSIQSREQFDERHHDWIESVRQFLRTNRQAQLAYGQGQKTINVFLKFYVDWSSRPTADVAARLRPWLHCPLDRVVMEALRSRDVNEWRRRIWEPHYLDRVTQQCLIDALWSLQRPMGARARL